MSRSLHALVGFALLSSMAVYGERLSDNEWIGIGLIGVGLALIIAEARLASSRRPALPAEPVPLDGG